MHVKFHSVSMALVGVFLDTRALSSRADLFLDVDKLFFPIFFSTSLSHSHIYKYIYI